MNHPTPAIRSAALPPPYQLHASTYPIERSQRPAIVFRQFRVLPAARTLLFKNMPVEIGGRAFDLLMVLLRSRGEIVGKEEIMRHVWPSTIVDEGNLRFQMAMLRKALGPDRDMIKTVTGRGYLFIADVEAGAADLPPSAPGHYAVRVATFA